MDRVDELGEGQEVRTLRRGLTHPLFTCNPEEFDTSSLSSFNEDQLEEGEKLSCQALTWLKDHGVKRADPTTIVEEYETHQKENLHSSVSLKDGNSA